MVKVVLFDLDDTLYDYSEVSDYAIMKSHDIIRKKTRLSKDEFLKLYVKSKNEVRRELNYSPDSHDRLLYFQRACEKLGLNILVALNLYERYRVYFVKKMRARYGVLSSFKEIKRRGMKIAIITNEVLHIQIKKLKKIGVIEYVDCFVSSENVGVDKPDRRIFEYALKKFRAKPSEAVMIGNSEGDDVVGANRAGIKSVLIKTKKNQKSKADFVVNEIPEVLNILEELG